MIKKILIGIAILVTTLITFGGVGIYYIYNQQKKMGEGRLVWPENKIIERIPFYYASSGHILIDVKVEGSKETYPFILDSGASNFIFKNHSDEFDFESNGKGLGMGATGNFFFTNIKKADSIQIQGLTFTNVNFEEYNFDFNCFEHVYGLIGNGTMKHLDWQIDFKNQEIIVAKKLNELPVKENAIEIPLRINKTSFHPYASIQLAKGKKYKTVIVDLGSSGTLSLSEEDFVKDSLNLKEKRIFGKQGEGLGGQNDDSDTERVVLAETISFKRSKYKAHKMPVDVSPTSLNLLGLGFLKNYKTTISWSNEKLILEPYDSVPNFLWKTRGFGMRYDSKTKKLRIKSVTNNSPAYKLKIPVNAEIIELDGKLVTSEKELCEFKNKKNTPDTLKIKIKHKNTVKEVGVPKTWIFD